MLNKIIFPGYLGFWAFIFASIGMMLCTIVVEEIVLMNRYYYNFFSWVYEPMPWLQMQTVTERFLCLGPHVLSQCLLTPNLPWPQWGVSGLVRFSWRLLMDNALVSGCSSNLYLVVGRMVRGRPEVEECWRSLLTIFYWVTFTVWDQYLQITI